MIFVQLKDIEADTGKIHSSTKICLQLSLEVIQSWITRFKIGSVAETCLFYKHLKLVELILTDFHVPAVPSLKRIAKPGNKLQWRPERN